jgi:ring-1,2-phenylacetyl-CoA epoxidase subunit PaaD
MSSMSTISEQDVWDILREIPDPEIQTINLVDLGVIRKIATGERIVVEIMPTFVGCPALEMMQREIKAKLAPYGEVEVKVVYSESWTTERITEAGRAMLREAGIAPPARQKVSTLPMIQKSVIPGIHDTPGVAQECPFCHSQQTHMENLFGPTPCRAICYCDHCHQPFEQFKVVS